MTMPQLVTRMPLALLNGLGGGEQPEADLSRLAPPISLSRCKNMQAVNRLRRGAENARSMRSVPFPRLIAHVRYGRSSNQ